MTINLKPYPAYRDSGVEWLGKVPERWEVRKLTQMGKLLKGKGGNKGDEVSTGIPCVRYGDLYTTHTYFIRKSRSFIARERVTEYTSIKFGDVLFAASGETIDEIGKSAVNLMQTEACCGGDIIVLRPTYKVDARFLGYSSDCYYAVAQKATIGRGITVMHIYGKQLKYVTLVLPPADEQTAIARFLDHVNRRIQRYIRAKQKLIELQEEQKQTIIHQAVTGQIDVRTGQPYSAYKDSGVEWLGRVPEHWDVRRLKTLCSMKSGEGITAMSIESTGPFPVYGGNGLRGYTSDYTHDGDFALVGRQGALCGNVHVAHGRFWASEHAVVVTLRPSYVIRWFSAVLGMMNLNQYSIAAAQPGLAVERVLNLWLAMPALPEQTAIARFLDHAIANMDAAITSSRRQIEFIKEYRTRLITDVVTGKLDVREAAVRLPPSTSFPPECGEWGPQDTLGAMRTAPSACGSHGIPMSNQ